MAYPFINDIIEPSSVSWGLDHNNFSNTSFTNVTQTVVHPGALWKGKMSFECADEGERVDLEIFIESLEGRAGRFKVFNPAYKSFPVPGLPVVAQANQTGRALMTSGYHPNTLVARKGQCFTINHELKRLTEDAFSDANGVATLRFTPRLRVIPVLGTALEFNKPYMLATLDDTYNPLDFDSNLNASVNLSFTEAIYERV